MKLCGECWEGDTVHSKITIALISLNCLLLTSLAWCVPTVLTLEKVVQRQTQVICEEHRLMIQRTDAADMLKRQFAVLESKD